jgi:MoaD family protein
MQIRVRLFASYAEVVGRSEMALELPPGARVGDVLVAVRSAADASRLPPSPLVAVNLRYAKLETVLADGDEVALIPPVAGG